MIPVLPDEIAELLDDATPASDAASDAEVAAFLDEHTSSDRPEILAGWVKALGNHFTAGASRHGSTLSVTVGAMKEARLGCFPAQMAINTIRPMFLEEVAKPPISDKQGTQRTGKVAASEFGGIVAWAIGQANAADLDEVRRRLDERMSERVHEADASEFGGAVTAPGIKHSGHLGMAVKLAGQYAGRLLYVHGVGWHHWDGKRFAPDADGAARRAVHAMLKRDRRIVLSLNLAAEEQDKRLRQIARYETASAITGILTEAAVLQVFSVTADELNADPWLFNCQNGTLDLHAMKLRPHDPADRSPRSPTPPTTPISPAQSGSRSSQKCCQTRMFAPTCNGSPGCRCSAKSTATSRSRPSPTAAGPTGKPHSSKR
jgi:hypothetical protein